VHNKKHLSKTEEIGINRKMLEETFREEMKQPQFFLSKTRFYWIVGFGDSWGEKREHTKI